MSMLGGWICSYCHILIVKGKVCESNHPDKVECDKFVKLPLDMRSYRNKPKQK